MSVDPHFEPEPEPDEEAPQPIPPDPRAFQYVRASRLLVDKRAQREIDPDRVQTLGNEFDWTLFEAVTACPSDNGFFSVIEAQHRVLAVKERDALTANDTLVPCMIVSPKEIPQQAQIALDIANGRKGHSAYEKWQLRLHAGHEHERAATHVMQSLGIRVGRSTSSHTIGAVATVRRIVHGGHFTPGYGSELLGRTATTILVAFPNHDPESNTSRWDSYLLGGVAETLHRNPDTDIARLSQALRVRPAPQWVSLAKGKPGEPPHIVIAANLISLYNKGLRKGRLGW